MAGYDGFSMSNNARAAYARGEMPISKWTKTKILELAEDAGFDCPKLKKVRVDILKKYLLNWVGWHHTSKFYNQTDFYEFDYDFLEKLTCEDIEKWIAESKKVKQ